jgi:arylsulfatase A-like enzyme
MDMMRKERRRALRVAGRRLAAGLFVAALAGAALAAPVQTLDHESVQQPNVLFVTVDALRADRLSAYGYGRSTSPNVDRLIEQGVRFTHARTIEPLTNPALCSMLTSRYPHEHASTRNGLRMRSGFASISKALQGRGYHTAAFVGNWTLRDKLSGLGEHFEHYEEIFTRRRWFGFVRREATADDLTEQTLDWIRQHVQSNRERPFFAWVHYVEPHAPYRLHEQYLDQLGVERSGSVPPQDRYDTEIAFVDASIGHLLREVRNLGLMENTLIVFTADHGESLGEHKYWGHGRHLYEPTLRIPMSLTWEGRLAPRTIDSPALLIDLAPTVLSLLAQPHPSGFRGYDWGDVLTGGGEPPSDRLTHYQAHRGAVLSRHDSDLARRSGLLEVGLIQNGRKEIFRIQNNRRWIFDLESDPLEVRSLDESAEDPTEGLLDWMRSIYDTLAALDQTLPEPLDEESAEQLKSLGYVD